MRKFEVELNNVQIGKRKKIHHKNLLNQSKSVFPRHISTDDQQEIEAGQRWSSFKADTSGCYRTTVGRAYNVKGFTSTKFDATRGKNQDATKNE